MRFLIILLGILTLAACNSSEPLEILQEYEYPLDSLADGKMFIFHEKGTDQATSYTRKKVVEGNAVYMAEQDYQNGVILMASKIRITKKGALYEACYRDSLHKIMHDWLPVTVESHNVLIGKPYRGTHKVFRYKSGDYWERLVLDETFEKHDTLHWNGTPVDVLVFTYSQKHSIRNRHFPYDLFSEDTETGKKYYAKGLGLIRFTAGSANWTLAEIMPWKFPTPGESPQ